MSGFMGLVMTVFGVLVMLGVLPPPEIKDLTVIVLLGFGAAFFGIWRAED